jgi:pimeloyl-ACP methyl ester carboxylesterase
MNTEFTEISGLKIRHRIHRNPGAPKLLLTNALPMSIRCWDSHWDELSESFELLALDLPGFGLSEARHELLNPTSMADFLVEVIQKLSWEDSIAIGPDIGVPVVLSLAQRRPELLKGIVVFDGPGFYPPDFSFDLRWSMKSGFFRKISKLVYSPKIYLDQVLRRGYKRFRPSHEVYQEYLSIARDKERFQNTLTFISSYPVELLSIGNKLDSIRVPTLIAWGAKDSFVPPSNGLQLKQRIPESHLHIFPGCGHFSHEDAGQAFTEVLRSWQNSLRM